MNIFSIIFLIYVVGALLIFSPWIGITISYYLWVWSGGPAKENKYYSENGWTRKYMLGGMRWVPPRPK